MISEEKKRAVAQRLRPFGHGKFEAGDLLAKAGFRDGEGDEKMLEDLIARVAAGEPIQYVSEVAFFGNLPFFVDPSVLIPRQETEELAHFALEILQHPANAPKMRVMDVGTGSGCLACFLHLKMEEDSIEMFAVDVSSAALKIAKKNAFELGAMPMHFVETDILKRENWADLPADLAMIVSNPPYVLESEKDVMGPDVLKHEPHLALFAPTERPLIFYETIGEMALEKLQPGGILAFECNEFNVREVAQLLDNQGFMYIDVKKDIHEKERFVFAEKPEDYSPQDYPKYSA